MLGHQCVPADLLLVRIIAPERVPYPTWAVIDLVIRVAIIRDPVLVLHQVLTLPVELRGGSSPVGLRGGRPGLSSGRQWRTDGLLHLDCSVSSNLRPAQHVSRGRLTFSALSPDNSRVPINIRIQIQVSC